MYDEAPYQPLEVEEYQAMREAETPHLLLDVREPAEYYEARIADSVLIPMNDVISRLDEIRDAEVIVVQCRSGKRSAAVAATLRDAGLTAKIYNLEGGIIAWAQAGNPYLQGED